MLPFKGTILYILGIFFGYLLTMTAFLKQREMNGITALVVLCIGAIVIFIEMVGED